MKHNMFCFRCIFMFGISAMRVSPNSLSDWEVPWCQVSVRISLICMVYGPNMTQLTKILAKTPKSHRQPAVARVVCHFASDANIILGKETTETTNAPLRGIGLVDWTVLQVQAASRMWRYPTWLLHSWLQADETKKCHFSLYITTNSNSNLCWVCTVQCSAYSSYLPPKETIKWSRPNITTKTSVIRCFFISKSRYQNKHWCHQDISALVQQEPVLPGKTPMRHGLYMDDETFCPLVAGAQISHKFVIGAMYRSDKSNSDPSSWSSRDLLSSHWELEVIETRNFFRFWHGSIFPCLSHGTNECYSYTIPTPAVSDPCSWKLQSLGTATSSPARMQKKQDHHHLMDENRESSNQRRKSWTGKRPKLSHGAEWKTSNVHVTSIMDFWTVSQASKVTEHKVSPSHIPFHHLGKFLCLSFPPVVPCIPLFSLPSQVFQHFQSHDNPGVERYDMPPNQ